MKNGSQQYRVIGVDVGGRRKGFNAVLVVDDAVVDRFASGVALDVAKWCASVQPQIIAIDAPCQWSTTGRARACERQLMEEGVFCFSTPAKKIAVNHPAEHFEWMLNGMLLYEGVSDLFPLFSGCWSHGSRCVIETFPHAVVCAIAGEVVRARPKSSVRRLALRAAGISDESERLTNIDFVDAALCAVAARGLLQSRFRLLGGPEEGFIVLPCLANLSLPSGFQFVSNPASPTAF
jgi:predicted nuclease with RNAse H fold